MTLTILLLLRPIEELVDHDDGRVRNVDTWVCRLQQVIISLATSIRGKPTYRQMDRVSVETDGLALIIVVVGERRLHVLERCRIVDSRSTVCGISIAR